MPHGASIVAPAWTRHLITGALLVVWFCVILGLPGAIVPNAGASGAVAAWQLQLASWLTFLALFITPGWLLADMLTGRLALDWLERLAMAFPLGIGVLALPGMAALLLHWTLDELTLAWILSVLLLLIVWFVQTGWRWLHGVQPQPRLPRWTLDERLLFLLLIAAFAYCLSTINLYKIDGDAYAVGTFAADAMAGLPLNAREPLFGTDLGPGVRMAFNQSLPMAYLWSTLAAIDPITLTAAASRAMVALWVLLATYALGKAAGEVTLGAAHSRRFGLFMTALQLLILVAAPFLRGDNVSIFFFERTTADKYMVPTTMLPIVFAFTLRYMANGQGRAWWIAAIATFAVSTIHPLIAAMMALALGAFAGFHWLVQGCRRVALQRGLAVIGLTVIAMTLPLIQLVLAWGEAPLAPSYPASIEGWPVGYRRVAALPYFYLPTLDVVGPLPDLTQLQASDATSTLNPFLVWRFAVNMNRRRLLLFDLDHYISDPNIFLEPPYLLALLLLPFLLWQIRRNLAAQFALSVTLAILFVMFNPFVTPLIGALVMPWILWRFVWILPYTLILALLGYRLLLALSGRWRTVTRFGPFYAPLLALLAVTVVATPAIANNLQTMTGRTAFAYDFPTPQRIFARLQSLTSSGQPVNVMAEEDVSVTLAAYVAKANVIAHRVPTTSEIFPADQQTEALQRLIDQARFFRTKYLTSDTLAILQRYQVAYVIAPSDSELNLQLQLATDWFTWLEDDAAYSLYAVRSLSTESAVLQGNEALAKRLWATAADSFSAALAQDPTNLLAKLGQAEIAHMNGQFTKAIALLQEAAQSNQAVLHYRLGQLYAEVGQFEQSMVEFTAAQNAAPITEHYHIALADACLNAGRMVCAQAQFEAAVADQNYGSEALRLIALADLWRQRGQLARALPYYQAAAALQPDATVQMMLANIYLESGQLAQADELLATLRTQHPLSTEALLMAARVKSRAGEPDTAIALYRRAILLQNLQGQETVETRLALAATYLDWQRLPAAHSELEEILWLQPNNATAYALQGELFRQEGDSDAAAQAYGHAFTLDPTQVNVYFALNNQLGQQRGRQTEMAALLERAMKANPDEAVLALALGDQLEVSGHTRSAIGAYHAAIDKFEAYTQPRGLERQSNQSGRAYAYARLAAVSEDMGEIEPAMNYYAAAAAAAPDRAWPQALLGDALRRRGEPAAAQAAYQHAIAIDPNDSDVYLRLADFAAAQGDQAQTDHYRELALQAVITKTRQSLNTQNPPVAAQNQATSLVATKAQADPLLTSDETLVAGSDGGKAGDAAATGQPFATLLRSVQRNLIDGDNLQLFRLLAHLYTTDGHFAEVRQLYEELIARGVAQGWDSATLAEYHKELGDLYLAQNRPTQAAAAYEDALALDVWWPQLHMGYARALDKLGQSERAIAELRQAVAMAPGYVDAQVTLASALEQQGEQEKALTINLMIANIHPGNDQATLALAHAWQARGQWARAENYYRMTIAQTPGSPDAYVGLAGLLMRQQRTDEAQSLLDQAIALDQQNSDAYLQAGLLAQQQNDPALADQWFDKALQLRVASPAISLNQVDLLQRAGNYAIAEKFARTRLEEQPGDPDLLLQLATLQRTQGHFSQALTTLLTMERQYEHDSRVPAALAELERAQGRAAEALTYYRKAIAMQPEVAAYYLAAGELWVAQGYPSRAVALLQSGIAQVAQPASLYATMATIELTGGRTESAHQILTEAQQRVGNATAIANAMGLYLVTAGNDKAAAWYQDLLQQRPQDAGLYAALGNFYLRSGRAEEAVTAFTQVVELEPANASHYVTLATAQTAAKQNDAAVASLQQAIALEPTLAAAYVALAARYADQAAWPEARTMYERALAVAPTNGVYYVQFAQFLLARGEKEAAAAQLEQASQLAPTAAMLQARAALYQTLDRNQEAESDLLLAMQQEPGNVDLLLALNNLYRKLKEEAKAQDMLTKAFQLAPALGDATVPGVSKAASN